MSDQDEMIELAWAAGFYDGEGSTMTNRHGEFRVQVGQVDPRVLERFIAAVGIGQVFGPYERVNPRHQRIYHLRYSGNKASLVIDRLWPYLGEVKKNQARIAWEKAGLHNPKPLKWHEDKLTLSCRGPRLDVAQ